MIIRGHDVDVRDALFFFAMPDGSVKAATRAELQRRLDAAFARETGIDLGEDWDCGVPRGFDEELADLAHGLDWLFDLCSVAMGHGLKRGPRLEDSGIVGTNYVGAALATHSRFWADTLEVQFATVTGEPAVLFTHSPFLFREFTVSEDRSTSLAGREPEARISAILEDLSDGPLGGILVRDARVWFGKLPRLARTDGLPIRESLVPFRSLAPVVAYADREGLL